MNHEKDERDFATTYSWTKEKKPQRCINRKKKTLGANNTKQLTSQNPPVTCDCSIGFIKVGCSGPKRASSFSAFSTAPALASSEA